LSADPSSALIRPLVVAGPIARGRRSLKTVLSTAEVGVVLLVV
jgi:hypothetical protein